MPAMPGRVAGHFVDAIDIPVFAVRDCEFAVDTDKVTSDQLKRRYDRIAGRHWTRALNWTRWHAVARQQPLFQI